MRIPRIFFWDIIQPTLVTFIDVLMLMQMVIGSKKLLRVLYLLTVVAGGITYHSKTQNIVTTLSSTEVGLLASILHVLRLQNIYNNYWLSLTFLILVLQPSLKIMLQPLCLLTLKILPKEQDVLTFNNLQSKIGKKKEVSNLFIFLMLLLIQLTT